MSKEAFVLPMAQDITIESERTGAPIVYWMAESTQRLFLGAKGVRLDWNVLSLDGNAQIKVLARRSIDGRNWTYFGNVDASVVPELSIDGQSLGITVPGTGSNVYAKDYSDFGARVQLGVQIRSSAYGGTPVAPASARLVMSATVLFERFTAINGLVSAIAVSTAGDLTTFSADNFDSGFVVVTVAGAAPSTLKFQIKLAADRASYVTVAETPTISAMGSYLLAIPQLGPYMTLTYTGGAASVTASAALVGRVN